jgi:hypothetical protein
MRGAAARAHDQFAGAARQVPYRGLREMSDHTVTVKTVGPNNKVTAGMTQLFGAVLDNTSLDKASDSTISPHFNRARLFDFFSRSPHFARVARAHVHHPLAGEALAPPGHWPRPPCACNTFKYLANTESPKSPR